MSKAYRVAISNEANGCYNCDPKFLSKEEYDELLESGDYCNSCQRVYIGYVDVRKRNII